MAHATLLAHLVAQRHWAADDALTEFLATAERFGSNYVPSQRQWERWCAGQVKREPRPLCRRVLETMFDHPVGELFAPPPIVASVNPWSSGGRSDAKYWTRGQVASESGGVRIYEEITEVADDSARFARRFRQVDERVLDQLDDDVRQLAIEYLIRPPYFAFRRIADLRTEVFSILDERHPLDQERRLYRVAGQLCGLLAHASADLGHPHEAETHARTALVCAELTDDDPLRAYIRWVQSNVAYWRGDYRRAAEIAHAGRDHASSGTAMLRLASQEARALAAVRDIHGFASAIGAARNARDQLSVADEPGVFHFSRGKAAYYASEAYCAMGEANDLREATRQAQEAIHLLTADPSESGAELLAAARIDLAAAHLASGDVDGFADELGPVLSIAPEHRTVPVIQRVRRISGELVPRTHGRLALELSERIDLFTAHHAVPPSQPALPE
jgi:hypothetical protein